MARQRGVTSDTGPFALIPEWVLDAEISDRAVRLYAVLSRYADNDNGTAFPSKRTLATRLRCSEASVARAIHELEQAGALLVEARYEDGDEAGRRQTSNQYTVIRGGLTSAEGVDSTTDGHPGITGDTPRTRTRKKLEPVELETSATSADEAAYDPLKGMKIDGRNLPWDALVDVTNADEKLEAGRIARGLKLIREAVVRQWPGHGGLTPEMTEAFIATEIAVRARFYRDRWPNVELTPTALAQNWSRVMTPQPGRSLDTALEAAQRGIDSARRTA